MLEREKLVAQVAQWALDRVEGNVLLMHDLQQTWSCVDATRWNRYARQRKPTVTWPEGTFDTVLMRLHHDKTAMEMMLHAAMSVLNKDGVLWIVGANDEGIKSWPKRLSPFFASVETVDIRKRCRVIRARTRLEAQIKPFERWWQEHTFLERSWKSLPGCFAKGRLDAGTQLLLTVLPKCKANRRVLDYACGIGILSQQVRRHFPEVAIDGLDFDAYAVESASRNVPSAQFFVSDAWHSLPNDRRYDLIVSNPPVHLGKSENKDALEALFAGAKTRLYRSGSLVIVVQRHFPVQKILANSFHGVECLAKNNHFWVWKAQP